jgi:hypothetical protein
MNMLIEIETQDERLGADLIEKAKMIDKKSSLPASAVLMKVHLGGPMKGKLTFLLSFRPGVDAGLMANWFCGKIKGRATKLLLDQAEVNINKEEIEKIVIEKLGREPIQDSI